MHPFSTDIPDSKREMLAIAQRGVHFIRYLTGHERAQLLLHMGYAPSLVETYFPVSADHEAERERLMQPRHDDPLAQDGMLTGLIAGIDQQSQEMVDALYDLAIAMARFEKRVTLDIARDDFLWQLMQVHDIRQDPEMKARRAYYTAHPQKWLAVEARAQEIGDYLRTHHLDKFVDYTRTEYDQPGLTDGIINTGALGLADAEIRLRRGRTPDGLLARAVIDLLNSLAGPSR